MLISELYWVFNVGLILLNTKLPNTKLAKDKDYLTYEEKCMLTINDNSLLS